MNTLNLSPPAPFSVNELTVNETTALNFWKSQNIHSDGSTPLALYHIDTGKINLQRHDIDRKDSSVRITCMYEVLNSSELFCGTIDIDYNHERGRLVDTRLFPPYKLTDDQIKKEVMEELKCIPLFGTSEIELAVKKGIVTFTGFGREIYNGSVESFYKKIAAEKAATNIEGVRAVRFAY